ncbi:MAG: PAS domain-containing protein [Actinomycetota bacterium]|nr:PAS domain-containing protein [Actinomycetota bacterium]
MARPQGRCWLEVEVVPVFGHALLGLSMTFRDITLAQRLQHELERTNRELDTAYEELQSTVEELETTNEEVQSTVEEQETTNEELQSTNEELETMNEELQSTNAELQAINDELGQRTQELNRLNTYLEGILSGLRGGVVVVDDDLRVRLWSERAQDMWGLRPAEALGAGFLELDIGLPVERLREPLRDCLGRRRAADVTLNAANRRGHEIRCSVQVTPLHGDSGDILGAILVMEQAGCA